ncbi:DNA cytosine methyltransferase [Mesorhizobium sp.]|uniref:DNA cytosine methyltransferase n=1 Tax=Mesorhizobium sp. TaxID=1871066 RepID=UPI00345D5FE5
MGLHPGHLDIISLCTGGGGLDLGIELAIPSARTVCMVEREGFAIAQLVSAMEEGLMAPAAIWSDARTFDGRAWRGRVDGVIGGIPCQPHSVAGRRRGSGDERDLWSTARRIIVQSGAWFVLIENVGGMLSAKPSLDPGALRVRRDLYRLGFDVEGGLFTATEVGASHQRERVFILAVADGCGDRNASGLSTAPGGHGIGSEPAIIDHGGYAVADGISIPEQPLADAAGSGRRSKREIGRPDSSGRSGEARRVQSRRLGGEIHPRGAGVGLADANDARLQGYGQSGERPGEWASGARGGELADASIERSGSVSIQSWRQDKTDAFAHRTSLFPPGPGDLSSWRDILERSPELEPAIRRVADGLASRLDIARVDRLRMLGNGVVPLQAAYAIRTLATRLAERGSTGATRLVHLMEMSE